MVAWKRLLKCGEGLRSERWSTAAWLVLLLVYTTVRLVANFFSWLNGESWGICGRFLHVDFRRFPDAFATPVVSGLGVFYVLRRSTTSELHVWCRRIVCCLAWFGPDPWLFDVVVAYASYVSCESYEPDANQVVRIVLADTPLYMFLGWSCMCSVMQIFLTNLKLKALGLSFTAKACQLLTAAAFCCVAVACCLTVLGVIMNWPHGQRVQALNLLAASFFSLLAIGVVQCVTMSWASCRAVQLGKGNHDIRCAAYCLRVSAALAILSPVWVLLSLALRSSFPMAESVSISLQILYALLLSGMIGPKAWEKPLEAYQKIARLSAFLASQRISFPGKIHKDASDCIVSFPGKYGKQWDDAVSRVTERSDCSMACVFLTEKESGLGEHADNPEEPGECWCKALYGQMPAQAYLNVLDLSQEVLSPEDVAIRDADAAALGQILIVKHQQMTNFQWQIEFSRAFKDAEDRCQANLGRAPWGCRWFEEWRKNVEQSAQSGQTLHVSWYPTNTLFFRSGFHCYSATNPSPRPPAPQKGIYPFMKR